MFKTSSQIIISERIQSTEFIHTVFFKKTPFLYYHFICNYVPQVDSFARFQRFVFLYFIKLHSENHNTLHFRLLLHSPVS